MVPPRSSCTLAPPGPGAMSKLASPPQAAEAVTPTLVTGPRLPPTTPKDPPSAERFPRELYLLHDALTPTGQMPPRTGTARGRCVVR